jgi:hypothetical protein
MKQEPASSVGYEAERLWENKKFRALIKEAQVSQEGGKGFDFSIIPAIRSTMKAEGFVLSPFWDRLIHLAITSPDFDFVTTAYKMGANSYTMHSDPVLGDYLIPDIFPEAKADDIRRTTQEISGKMQEIKKRGSRVKKEQPWPSKDLGKEAYELHCEGKTYGEIADIFTSRNLTMPVNGQLYWDEDVRKLIQRYKKRTGNP